MQITKLQVAAHQLNVAIRLFLEGDYLSSLTLAGAAEEILGKISKRTRMPVAVESIIQYHLPDTDPALSYKERRSIILGILNEGRNAAKHAENPEETHFNVDIIYPLQMIMRAIPMANHLGAVIGNEVRMREWIHSNPDATK